MQVEWFQGCGKCCRAQNSCNLAVTTVFCQLSWLGSNMPISSNVLLASDAFRMCRLKSRSLCLNFSYAKMRKSRVFHWAIAYGATDCSLEATAQAVYCRVCEATTWCLVLS
jgi:hypothetical protein